VHPTGRTPESRLDTGAGTLGDVVYADKAQARIPESEWIELVQSIAAGDQHALQALYERMHRLVYTLSARITGSRETAEEVTLDVFHDVWRRASSYEPAGGSVVGWIMNQARSRAIDRLRFDQRKKRVQHGADMPPPAIPAAEPHEDLQHRDQGRVLRDALALLTAGERQAIETAFFSGLTHTETAARLNQPIGTVKTRIRSGLEKLRQALGKRGREL
jgi:RNA polymerase sigma-70 factor (ECF subfamily)